MFATIVLKELKSILVSPKFPVTFAVSSVLVLLSVFMGIREYRASVDQYRAAGELVRQEMREARGWMSLNNRVYREPDPMQIFASGVHNDVGRLSGISQWEPVKLSSSAYSDDSIFAFFLFIDFTFIVQVVLTLFAILFTYDSINGECESGTLQLMLSNGRPPGERHHGEVRRRVARPGGPGGGPRPPGDFPPPGFKKYEQSGVTLRAGQTAVINIKLSVGTLSETVTVTADSPIVDLAKIEQGRTLSTAEIKTLPLTSRNPYNFALLQPGVVGFETNEFGVPRLTANGALLRVNYQVDGSNNTQKDRAGLRQMPMSEVMIREVKVITTGYAPEFGQTMGLVYNAITPSGTNAFRGQGSYRFQRQSMVATPFYTAANAAKPPTDDNVYTFDLGGPIVRDKTHFFGGYEHTERDLSGLSVITITPANQQLLAWIKYLSPKLKPPV